MNRALQILILSFVFALLSSCASIVSHSSWPVDLRSTPSGAAVTITNRKGVEVFKGVTPSLVTLKSGAGFFKKESYTLRFQMDGYAGREIPLECKVNGWYWGNILFGGWVGWLIVDPATGAMYKLGMTEVAATLTKNSTGSNNMQRSLRISSINEIPKSMVKDLVRIN